MHARDSSTINVAVAMDRLAGWSPPARGTAHRTCTATRRRPTGLPDSPDSGGGLSGEAARTTVRKRKPAACLQFAGGHPLRLLGALASGERALGGRRSSLSAERISAAPHSVATGTSHGSKTGWQSKRFPPRPHPELDVDAEVSSSGRGCDGGRLAERLDPRGHQPASYVAHPVSHRVQVAGQGTGDERSAQPQTAES